MSSTIAAAPTYPWVICNAVTRVFDVDELRKLHDSALKLLVALVKKVDKENGTSPIFARRDTLAREIGKSVETVYRALRILEDHGLIEEREQSQDPTGRLSESVITLSRKVCSFLQLPVDREGRRTQLPSVTDGRPIVYRSEQQFLDQSNEATKRPLAEKKSIRVGKFHIPADLSPLLERGVVATAILALMKRAKGAGKRLSDVMECVAGRVSALDLRAKRLYAYLLSAIDGVRNYAADAETIRVDRQLAAEDQAVTARGRELQGRWFAPTGDSNTRLHLDKGALCVFERNVDGRWRLAATTPFGKDVVAAIDAGRLVGSNALPVDCYL